MAGAALPNSPPGLGVSLHRWGRVPVQPLWVGARHTPSEMPLSREIRNVELLKLRFGEAPMHFCEVMLKVGTQGSPPTWPSLTSSTVQGLLRHLALPPQDMADSRRINANIREEDEKRPAEEQPPFGVYAVILSSEFWPPFKDEKLEVPEDIREALEVYCKKYEKLKVPSTPPCVRNQGAGDPSTHAVQQAGCGLSL